MRSFSRADRSLSLCGLNCLLCPMQLGGHCGGCGNGNQSCPIARCSLEHGSFEYCFQCPSFPCEKYDDADEHDSFITHRNQLRDLEKAQAVGTAAYGEEQRRKRLLLVRLLSGYNDGRRKTLYCVATNLLDIGDVEAALRECEASVGKAPIRERAARMAHALKEIAARRGIELKLRKKLKR